MYSFCPLIDMTVPLLSILISIPTMLLLVNFLIDKLLTSIPKTLGTPPHWTVVRLETS